MNATIACLGIGLINLCQRAAHNAKAGKLMLLTNVQDTCTRNLYKLTFTKNLHICQSDLQQLAAKLFCASFLHEIEHVLGHARNLQSRDSMHVD